MNLRYKIAKEYIGSYKNYLKEFKQIPHQFLEPVNFDEWCKAYSMKCICEHAKKYNNYLKEAK